MAPEDLERVLRLLREVKFGTVTLVIQDGRVVQIDKLEKIRLK
ncbi:MAG: YezD family protein [Oscillospiraceae bacterium]|nr:YezD family protein [Oscillospiraceae bacterium]